MGWISDRAMRTGGALYTQGPKRKGPLKRIVVMLHGDHSSCLFGVDFVLLECGHTSRSYGGQRAICAKCPKGAPPDSMNDFGYADSLKVPVSEAYQKNFTQEELKARQQ